MKNSLLFVFIINITNLYSQSDSVLDFYPLQVGNYWQYHVIFDSAFDYEDTTYYSYREVVGDTVMLNGQTYFAIQGNNEFSNYSNTEFLRVDTGTGCIMEYDAEAPNGEILHDSLYMMVGDTFTEPYRFTIIECTSIDTVNILAHEQIVKSFRMPIINLSYVYKLAYGLGVIYWRSVVVDIVYASRTSEITYAKINGQEYGSLISDVCKDASGAITFYLFQNFPNPFNPATTINYSLSEAAFVQLKVFDVLGRDIKTLTDKFQSAGNYKIEFDASDMPNGVYIYKLTAGNFTAAKKMILLK